jgi:hypothetical protein
MPDRCVRQDATRRDLFSDCTEHQMGSGIHWMPCTSLLFGAVTRGPRIKDCQQLRGQRVTTVSWSAQHTQTTRPPLDLDDTRAAAKQRPQSWTPAFYLQLSERNFFTSFFLPQRGSPLLLFTKGNIRLIAFFFSLSSFFTLLAFRFLPKHDEKNTLSTKLHV